MTVSAVLNNRPGYASTETRQRVLKVVEEMRYQPNAVARGLTRRRMNTLGIVMSFEGKLSITADRYLSPIIDGIVAAGKSCHQRVLVITEDHWEEVQENLSSYLDGHCDGLIFILPILPEGAFEPLMKRQIPLVIVGDNRPEAGVAVVDLDNVGAARDAVRFLREQGHRRIAFLQGDRFLLSSSERESGYRLALEEGGIAYDERLVVPGEYNARSGYERTQRLLSGHPVLRPTAIFCGDDSIALGAQQALQEQGLRIPEEMSLIGVNDDKEASLMQPGLTTVRQPLRLMGEMAVDMVLAQISRAGAARRKILLDGELVIRESVGPVPRSLTP